MNGAYKNINAVCHICETESNFLMGKDGHRLYQCPDCRLIFVFPQPTKNYLAQEFYSEMSGYQKYKVKDLFTTKESKKTKKILDYLEKSRQDPKNHNRLTLLDVGCSSGEFLYHAKKRLFSDVYGVELNKITADIAKANGLNVYNGTLEEAVFEENFFDFIFLGDNNNLIICSR